MFKELEGQALVGLGFYGKLESNTHQVETEHAHPAGGVRLLQYRPSRQLVAAIYHRDVIQPQKAAFKDVISRAVDLVHPPCEVDQQFMEALLEELAVAFPRSTLLRGIHAPDGPCMHRRIQVGE